jgi:uncharacterized protein with PIN domain
MTVCLDTFALLAWIQGEPAAERVDGDLRRAAGSEDARCLMSAVNLGEAFYILGRRAGLREAELLWDRCARGIIPVAVVEATLARVRSAARIKAGHRLSYADAFAVVTAVEHRAPLLTGAPEILALQDVAGLEVVALA